MKEEKLYCVYDRVSRVSSSPFVAPTHFEAYKAHIVAFQKSLKDNPNLNFDDFELHFIGFFDSHYVQHRSNEIITGIDYLSYLDPEDVLKFEAHFETDGYITVTPAYLEALESASYKFNGLNEKVPMSRTQLEESQYKNNNVEVSDNA